MTMLTSRRLRRIERHHKRKSSPELNLVPFIDILTLLIFFLLMSSVAFSRITILNLSVPPPNTNIAQPQTSNEELVSISITVRNESIEVSDNKIGLIKRFDAQNGIYDLKGLSELLQNMKDRVPNKNDATILTEANVPYEKLVEVMDTVKTADVVENNIHVQVDLFPEISLGDAAPRQ